MGLNGLRSKILIVCITSLCLFLLMHIVSPAAALGVLQLLTTFAGALLDLIKHLAGAAKRNLDEAALTLEKNLARQGIVDDTLGKLIRCDAAIVCDSEAVSGSKNTQMVEIVNQMGQLQFLKYPLTFDTLAECRQLCSPLLITEHTLAMFPESFHYPSPCLKFVEHLGMMEIRNKRMTADGTRLLEKKFNTELPQCRNAISLKNPDVRTQLEQALRIFTNITRQQIQTACETNLQQQYLTVAQEAVAAGGDAPDGWKSGVMKTISAMFSKPDFDELPVAVKEPTHEHCRVFADMAVMAGTNPNRLLSRDRFVEDDNVDSYMIDAPGVVDIRKKGKEVYENCKSDKCRLEVTREQLQMKPGLQYCTPQPHQQGWLGNMLPTGTRVWEVDRFCQSANKETLKALAAIIKAQSSGPDAATITATTTITTTYASLMHEEGPQ